jgi:DNA helicase-2/ATP-dependent DNA helicase PcrA
MDFEDRYKALNDKQRQAVDTIDGPLMVIAGPGTGKTELLSMRVAAILKRTDTLPENILCLTYTDSGVTAMRRRLTEIIGPAAYKVAIHTFHSFSTEVISHNRKFFYNGASFRPADELNRYEIVKGILEELEPGNPLGGQMNGVFTHLSDILSVISELKSSGLTGAELRNILDANDAVIEQAEKLLAPIFAPGIKKTTIESLRPLPKHFSELSTQLDTPGVSTFADILSDSLSIAITEADTENSTKPITAWRNAWLKKNERGDFVMKSKERQVKLRAVCSVYDQFTGRMQEAGLFDFDDMILNTVHALELMPELRYNLQEQYLYLMVDEFQDTNLAQMRILLSLTNNEVNEGNPNLMVVGDDDQAIYGFQGATVGNIHSFVEKFPRAPRIVLTDNYRSNDTILSHARSVISLGHERLENLLPDVKKTLTSRKESDPGSIGVRLIEMPSAASERHFIANDILKRIQNGQSPGSIAVLARRHHELVNLLPYFTEAGIKVNYERQDNVLDLESIRLIEYISTFLIALLDGKHDTANAMLPELLAHPAFNIDPLMLWKLSLKAHQEHKTWLEVLPSFTELAPIHTWLIEQSQAAAFTPLERMCDIIIGVPQSDTVEAAFTSPLYTYFFSQESLENNTSSYLTHLDGLIAIRSRLREYYSESAPTLRTFIEFLRLQRESGTAITSFQPASVDKQDAVTLMTAHKSKGLEFDTVYITGAVESAWGEKARSKNRLIGYPENLPLKPAGDSPDDRLRLFFVAMTRARQNLTITYSLMNDSGKEQLAASFLTSQDWKIERPDITEKSIESETTEIAWYQPIIRPISPSMKELLKPRLEQYKLNATHLSNFLDLSRGGPDSFIINDLLKFPQAATPLTGYGRAIHTALQRAHLHVIATGEQKPHEDVLKDFETALDNQYLPPEEFEHFLQRGSLALNAFLGGGYGRFMSNQRTELNFASQGVVIGDAHLTGILDVVEIKESSITITDYKTGKAVYSWQGKSDYEKIKLHRYRTQLQFYNLLISESRDYSKYSVDKSIIQFVEPTRSEDIIYLEASFTKEECERLKLLIQAVWRHIMSLEMPDTSRFEPTYKGILEFEDYLIDNFSTTW